MKQKLLFLVTRPPIPTTDGTRQRILNELKYLANFWTIDLLIIGNEKPDNKAIEKMREVINGEILYSYIPKYKSILRSSIHIFSREPLQTFYFYSRKISKNINKISKKYQLFYCHTIRLAKYLLEAKKISPYIINHTLLDFNDAISFNYHLASIKARGVWGLIYYVEKNKVRNYELYLLRTFKHFSIITKRDRNWIYKNWITKYKDKPYNNINIIRYGINIDLTKYEYNPENNNLVFIGNLYYPPNRQGIRIFYKKIWPLVTQLVPNSKLIIIGKGSKETFKNRADVKSLGFLESPYKIIVNQAAFLNPVMFGAGISTKTILALALGMPVISTKEGLSGIENINSQNNIFTIDYKNKELSAKIIANILTNYNKLKRNNYKGKKLVSSLYNLTDNNKRLNNLLTKISKN